MSAFNLVCGQMISSFNAATAVFVVVSGGGGGGANDWKLKFSLDNSFTSVSKQVKYFAMNTDIGYSNKSPTYPSSTALKNSVCNGMDVN